MVACSPLAGLMLSIYIVSTLNPVNSESKCPSFSSVEDSDVYLKIEDGTKLYGSPGTQQRIPIEVHNKLEDDISLMFLFHESFPIQSLQKDIHAEMVSGISPTKLIARGNSTSLVHVNLHISHFIPDVYRGKVTLTAKLSPVNLSQADSLFTWRRSLSFYFTVLNDEFRFYDSSPPVCLKTESCELDEYELCSTEGSCDEGSRKAVRMRVIDPGAGIQSIRLIYPARTSYLIFNRFTIGTREAVELIVKENSCDLYMEDDYEESSEENQCESAASVRIEDLAGNVIACNFGDVPSRGTILYNQFVVLLATLTLRKCLILTQDYYLQ